jgi:uncharacterized protein
LKSQIVGIGDVVKASATPRLRDTSALGILRDRLGKRFRLGIVLHLGSESLPLDDRIAAVPLAGLWSD